jgi:hypothetical protein
MTNTFAAMSPPLDHLNVTASTDNSENVMDSLTSEFEAVRLALPDPESELFHQYLNKLGTFHPFPKLPLELRTVIWRYAFPRGRKVMIDETIEEKLFRCFASRGIFRHIGRTPPLPAVFHVNKESRAIALSAYTQILPSSPNCGAAVYLHLDLDTFVLRDVNNVWGLRVPFAGSVPMFVETLGKIQVLEIINSHPSHIVCSPSFFHYLKDPYWWNKMNGHFPNHFKNLRRLVFAWPRNSGQARERHKRALEKLGDDCGPALKSWFERKREATGDYEVPEIIFEP